MKVEPDIRSRLFPALDDLVEQMTEAGFKSYDVIAALSIFALERSLDDLPLPLPEDQMKALMQELGKEIGE